MNRKPPPPVPTSSCMRTMFPRYRRVRSGESLAGQRRTWRARVADPAHAGERHGRPQHRAAGVLQARTGWRDGSRSPLGTRPEMVEQPARATAVRARSAPRSSADAGPEDGRLEDGIADDVVAACAPDDEEVVAVELEAETRVGSTKARRDSPAAPRGSLRPRARPARARAEARRKKRRPAIADPEAPAGLPEDRHRVGPVGGERDPHHLDERGVEEEDAAADPEGPSARRSRWPPWANSAAVTPLSQCPACR
jgi:hypothetical protein